jgi:hypothetical protein
MWLTGVADDTALLPNDSVRLVPSVCITTNVLFKPAVAHGS